MMRLRLPPYGAKLQQKVSSGTIVKNDVFLFCGRYAWSKAKDFSSNQCTLCLPPGDDPSHYHWPVHALPILIFDTGGMTVTDMEFTAYCLLHYDAEIVRAVYADLKIAIYRQGKNH